MVKRPKEGDILDDQSSWKLIDRALTRSMQIHPKHAGYLILELLKQIPDLEARIEKLEGGKPAPVPAPKPVTPRPAVKKVPVKGKDRS